MTTFLIDPKASPDVNKVIKFDVVADVRFKYVPDFWIK